MFRVWANKEFDVNKNRNIFALDGITGMLIATALLLGILVGLTVWSLNVQKANATNFYKVEHEELIKMRDKSSANEHMLDAK